MITNDAVIFGILFSILGLVFLTYNSKSSFWKKFYTFFPVILVCYFFPSFLNTTGVINSDNSNLYYVASRYLLPCSLVLLTISVDLKEIIKLGPKALIMFFTGTLGIMLGGPFALFAIKFFFPDILNIEIKELANGMTTIAGSWIGGGANQAAMMEVFNVDSTLFSKMVAVDIICANVLLAFLLVGVNNDKSIDKRLNADSSSIEEINKNLKKFINQKGFDIDFDKCINNKEIEDFVLNDRIEGAKNFDVNATPTIIINDKKFDKSLNYNNLKKFLEKLI